ncbi:MAG: alpha-galactosidase, partial [Candidatus Hydrogenedentes bacterium]|nr:alpha-galactosidase [Candidatus Hydrogenedentota bacterium]
MLTLFILSVTVAAVEVTPAEMQDAQQWCSAAFGSERAQPFFSFAYNGRPSSEFLPTWKTTSASRPIDSQRTQITLQYTDPVSGLEVRCEAVQYADFPTVEWTLYLKNGGASDTPVIENIQALDTVISRGTETEFVLHSNAGDNCTQNSYEPRVETLSPGSDKRIANTGGRPTQEAFPYFNIEWGGRGLIVVISWAGQWAAAFTREGAEGLRVRGGQELTHFVLHPGEEVRTPMIVLQFWRGGWARSQNVWRRWMFAHNVPRPGGTPLSPQLSLCTGNFYPNLMTESKQERAFLERHLDERIPFDCWWQDAGWYPCDGVGWPKVGTWEVDPVRFPNGLRELSDLMHANGKKVMVWFEPERVHADTWITANHPEWVHGGAGGGLLNLGDPACRAWLTDHIDALLTAQGIDDYRQDFNIDPLPFWRSADSEDRQGITEIRHVEGYFAYWDELRRRHPNMLIDSCASGGRRNDLETLRRAVPLLRSDWYWGPAGQQCQTYGLSMWIPYHGTGFIYPKDEYWIRSCMTAENSFGPDAAGVDNVDFAELRRLTEQCKKVAPYFLGDFWPLTPYT